MSKKRATLLSEIQTAAAGRDGLWNVETGRLTGGL